MINPFERFYDTEIAVYESGENSYTQTGEKTLIGNLICDIQPCSSDTESKIYGLSSQISYKIFCDKSDLIKNGRYISFGGKWYMIVSTEEWNFGMTAVIRGTENEG